MVKGKKKGKKKGQPAKAKSKSGHASPRKRKSAAATSTSPKAKPSSSSPAKTESSTLTEVARATSDVAELAAEGSRNFLVGLWDDFASSVVSPVARVTSSCEHRFVAHAPTDSQSQGHSGPVLCISVVDDAFNAVPTMRRKIKAFSNVKSKFSNDLKKVRDDRRRGSRCTDPKLAWTYEAPLFTLPPPSRRRRRQRTQ